MYRTVLLTLFLAFLSILAPQALEAQEPAVLLRFQIIEADGFTETDPAIADVREVLAELFRFRGYRLAAEAVVRAGSGRFRQRVAGTEGRTFSITGHASARGTDSRTATQVMLGELTLWVSDSSPVLETAVTVPVGQTVVLGTARPRADQPVLILVVRPEVR